MDVAFLVAFWCYGLLALLRLPLLTNSQNSPFANNADGGKTPWEYENQISSEDENPFENFQKWENCPIVHGIPKIICNCDSPHTVRCRSEDLDSHLLKNLTKELQPLSSDGKTPAENSISLLDLSIHGLKHLPSRSFDGLSLLGLVISRAGLTSIASDAFAGLEDTLAALGLPANNLTKIPSRALKDLLNMHRLDLSDNNIEVLVSNAFPILVQLVNLNLAGNKIKIIQPGAFASLAKLKVLTLSRNILDISQINSKSLAGLHSLSELSLQNNLLKGKINSDFLNNLQRLRKLDLSHNSLTKIPFGTLKNCEKLETLELSYNHIDVIEDHAFKYLTNMKSLDLSHNQIISVSGWSLAHIPGLLKLSISDNALLAVTADLLHQLPNMLKLDLSTNDITLMQPDVFNFTKQLQSLDLSENPIHCDCSIIWLWDWLETNSRLTENDKQSVVCTTPSTLENAPLVKLNRSDLICSSDALDYYHDSATDYEDTYEFRLSDAEVSLQEASWIDNSVQLVWHVDKRAIPYACQAIHIYEMIKVDGKVHQVLSEKMSVNCSSESQTDPHLVVVNVSGHSLRPGSYYRYCLVLIEKGTSDDQDSFLPGCSEILLLDTTSPSSEQKNVQNEPEVTSLTAGSQGDSLVVQTRIEFNVNSQCLYSVFIIKDKTVAERYQTNCSIARHSFNTLIPSKYTVCVQINSSESDEHKVLELNQMLHESLNVTATLLVKFQGACTNVNLQNNYESAWKTGPILTLLVTLPGLILIITLYVVCRRIVKGDGIIWRFDPRAGKRAKYFLYTGDMTPSVSLDNIPSQHPQPESSV